MRKNKDKPSFGAAFIAFIKRGNVIDLAVAVIIGAAFGKIVSSLVNDIIMPPVGMLIGGVDFKDLALVLKAAEGEIPAVTLNYGIFIQTILEFIIIAFSVFAIVRIFTRLSTIDIKKVFKRKQDEIPGSPTIAETPAPAPVNAADTTNVLLEQILAHLKKDSNSDIAPNQGGENNTIKSV